MGCRRLILVGDPRQLPATVFSKVAIDQQYDQSLFQRFMSAGHPVHLLSTQYRMHPIISAFPSRRFYEGQLEDSESIKEAVTPKYLPDCWYDVSLFRPLVFYSVKSAEQRQASSVVNTGEVRFILQLVSLLRDLLEEAVGPETWADKLAVITPYAEQARLLRRGLKEILCPNQQKPSPVDVSTVDGFQGREKDIIIFSAVRAESVREQDVATEEKRRHSIGFLADVRRMNVGLTRARQNLFVVGNGLHLLGNPVWKEFYNYAGEKGCQFNVNNTKSLQSDSYLHEWLQEHLDKNKKHLSGFKKRLPRFTATLFEAARPKGSGGAVASPAEEEEEEEEEAKDE
eukprot:GHVU01124028.1.p1 GENE.GHVU01124028.1~~GHVU01124028.1.p1  ORF type:complete len:342 (-),score=69.02 GHVU01124028.1:427-1452(-)